MLDIIATEAIEGTYGAQEPMANGYQRPCRPDPDEPTVKYDLRVVREKNGTLRWVD